MDEQLSRAVLVYIRYSAHDQPTTDYPSLRKFVGEQEAAEWKERIDALLDELFAMGIEWYRRGLTGFLDSMEAELRHLHPELNAQAIDRIKTYYAWCTMH